MGGMEKGESGEVRQKSEERSCWTAHSQAFAELMTYTHPTQPADACTATLQRAPTDADCKPDPTLYTDTT